MDASSISPNYVRRHLLEPPIVLSRSMLECIVAIILYANKSEIVHVHKSLTKATSSTLAPQVTV